MVKKIREDLKDIRFYYSRKDIFDNEEETIGINSICAKVKKYNSAVCDAPPKLYVLYISLYKENNTQESLAHKLGYSVEHISRMNLELVKFFHRKFQEQSLEVGKDGM